MHDFFEEQLEALRVRSLDRHLREICSAQGAEIEIGDRRLVNFSSNDYLGLANDPRLREAAIAAISEFGVGGGASRLISGTQSPHVRLERALAKWKGTEAALCFTSGYAAALGTIPAVVTKDDVILLDKLCHASLIDGAKLSGAILRVFPHNHLGKLESHLQWSQREHAGKRILIVTESVFSMDGDRAPLRELIELKKRFGALLLLDEAHAVGVIGPNGRGLAATENLNEDVDVQMGTLSKGATNRRPTLNAQRSTSNENSGSAIFPWIVGDEQAALDLALALQTEGFLVPAIRYPTVAKGAARLRITVTAAHEEDQIRALCEAIKRLERGAS